MGRNLLCIFSKKHIESMQPHRLTRLGWTGLSWIGLDLI